MPEQKIYVRQPILPVTENRETSPNVRQQEQPGITFQQVLKQEITGIKFSQHAQQRLRVRNIQVTDRELQKMNAGLEKVSGKGGKAALFLMGDVAMVVNVPNKTVITVMDGQNMKENVFTNIDSAIIL
ncbi:MAG: TIGR02530 family flagellar biosynthesis protein [Bacillota bacterium]|nr:flagellar protein [Bacillota bacterium]